MKTRRDTSPVSLELRRPDHLEDAASEAVRVHAQRLETGQASGDNGWVIGSAKDLVECVARVVVDAKGILIPANADFDQAVQAAHVVLERQPGQDVSMSSDVRAIAASAKKIVLNVRSVRDDYASGHGRAQVRALDEEMVTVIADATGLWVRWALRGLGHVLAGEADRLIAELRVVVSTLVGPTVSEVTGPTLLR